MSILAHLRELDRAFHLHPFTHHTDMHRTGTHIIERGEGCWLIDAEGRRLFDGLAGLWCVNVGYGRREINDAVARQMEKLAYYCSFFNSTTEPSIRLAEKLATLTPPGLKHTLFTNSGSEANETALKLIRGYWKLRGQPGKTKILSRTFSYHGVGLATTSMTGLPSCTQPFDLPLPGFLYVPGPYRYAVTLGATPTDLDETGYGQWCVAETARIIECEDPKTIAAIFVEPVQGAGGVIVPPEGYLRALRDLARKHDILFVADEVITAFGRLGAMFASDLWNLQPDLITTAKGITSGYLPLGATIVSDPIVEVLNTGGYLAHGFTYSGHPTTCAASLANLQIIETEKLPQRVHDDVGPYFQQQLRRFANHPAVGEVRGLGLIAAIELLPKAGRSALPAKSPLGVPAAAIAREEGLIVRGIRDLIALAPPLVISHEEVDWVITALGRTLDRFAEQRG